MAEHSSKLSRRLIDAADSFVLDEQGRAALRRNASEQERNSPDQIHPELARV
jgi:hypothetical protein